MSMHEMPSDIGGELRGEQELEREHRYALVSVSDKTGIADLAHALTDAGYEIISTGGTAKALEAEGIGIVHISDITGNPEAFDGRMKSISYQVEGGILYDRNNPKHVAEARKLRIPRIDVVVCNLYPFTSTITLSNVTLFQAIENIDVGGPTMIRAAAKNFQNVLVVVDPADYGELGEKIRTGNLDEAYRQALAAKAFAHLSFYDAQIARYLRKEQLPEILTLPLKKQMELRYGDNPDQQSAAVYQIPGEYAPLTQLHRLAGREPSATNITDMDAGIKAVELFSEPAAVVIKHNTPCGIALGRTPAEALARALEADSESAFGGVVVLNMPMTLDAAREIAAFKEEGKGQMDIIAVPDIEPEALELLTKIRKTTGIYTVGRIGKSSGVTIRMIDGGAVIQSVNDPEASFALWETVTKNAPTPEQLELMKVGWKFISRIRSNTVAVIDKALPMTRGIGTGQTSRVLATEIALVRAGVHAKGAILASDSFFPFDDSVKMAAKAGIAAIIQQGGSIRDADSIKAANNAGISMVFTHQRVFWH